MEFTQTEFDRLIKLPKFFKDASGIQLPMQQQRKNYEINCSESDTFILDYDRKGRYELKHKTQLREGKHRVLMRIEINAPPHMRLDGTTTGRNHIHIYNPTGQISYDINIGHEPLEILSELCKLCNIELPQILQGVM